MLPQTPGYPPQQPRSVRQTGKRYHDRQRITTPSLPDPSRALHRLPFPPLPRRGRPPSRVSACRSGYHPSIHSPQMETETGGILHLPYLTLPPTNHALPCLPYLTTHPTQATVRVKKIIPSPSRPRPRPWFAPKVYVRGRPSATTERTPSTVTKRDRPVSLHAAARLLSIRTPFFFRGVRCLATARSPCVLSVPGLRLRCRSRASSGPVPPLPSRLVLQRPQSHSPRPIGPHRTQALLCRRRRRTPIEEITKRKSFHKPGQKCPPI